MSIINLSEYINKKFNDAIQNSQSVDKIFISILNKYIVNLDQFLLMIELGANERCEQDFAFYLVASNDSMNVVNYLVDKYGFNNLVSGLNYDTIVLRSYEMFIFFLENGYKFDSDIAINYALSDLSKIKKLLEHGIHIDKIVRLWHFKGKMRISYDDMIELIRLYQYNIIDNEIYNSFYGTMYLMRNLLMMLIYYS